MITHQGRYEIHRSMVFHGVQDLDQLKEAIISYGTSLGLPGSDEYNESVGKAYEVYCEFFLRFFEGDTRLGVKKVKDTSANKYTRGFDFLFKSPDGLKGLCQTKFRGDPTYRFTGDALGTFYEQCLFMAQKNKIIPERRLLRLFTNLLGCQGIFSNPEGAPCDVIGYELQHDLIGREPSFWSQLSIVLEESCKPRTTLHKPMLWAHQQRMNQACMTVMVSGGRGKVICATGGGKTRCEGDMINLGLEVLGFKTAVLIAPTINLLYQHHQSFEKLGYLQGRRVVHVRTGDMPDHDPELINCIQTRKPEELVKLLQEAAETPTIFMVTYDSLAVTRNFYNAVQQWGGMIDLTIFDEFHRAVRQGTQEEGKVNMKELLTNYRSARNLFFSASLKRGRVLCAVRDEDIFGKTLEEVTYQELRRVGILVPKLNIKFVKPTAELKYSVQDSIKLDLARDGADAKEAAAEAAGYIAAYRDHAESHSITNMITFAKSVPNLEVMYRSAAVSKELQGVSVHMISSSVSVEDRAEIFEHVKTSTQNLIYHHSVAKEGTDIPGLNCGAISRGMDVISIQQGIGRLVRVHPDDLARLQTGEIKLNDPAGWVKYDATVYILVYDEAEKAVSDFITDTIRKILDTGLKLEDLAFGEVSGSKHKKDAKEPDGVAPILNGVIYSIEETKLQKILNKLEVEEFDERLPIMSKADRIARLKVLV